MQAEQMELYPVGEYTMRIDKVTTHTSFRNKSLRVHFHCTALTSPKPLVPEYLYVISCSTAPEARVYLQAVLDAMESAVSLATVANLELFDWSPCIGCELDLRNTHLAASADRLGYNIARDIRVCGTQPASLRRNYDTRYRGINR